MDNRRRIQALAVSVCVLALLFGSAFASAATTEPEAGAWQGKTSQRFQLYFGVSGSAVSNFRLTIREAICGKQTVHLPSSSLPIDEAGHFGGAVIPNRLEIEGTFTAADRVTGRIVSLETTGLPGCTRQTAKFSAHPR